MNLSISLAAYPQGTRFAVAVSGGSDSLALALLAQEWCHAHGSPLTALTVDHGLRAESAAESTQVGEWLAARGIAQQILRWEGHKPARGRMAAARGARYKLMADWCHGHATGHLLVAHTLDDQAETVLLNTRRGAGPDGLAAMPPQRELHGIQLLRPLLGVRRAALQGFLREAGQPWIDDPTNADPAYGRTRIRALLALGGDTATVALAEAAALFAQGRALFEEATSAWLSAHARVHDYGYATVSLAAWRRAEPEIARRSLVFLLKVVSGQTPRGREISRLCTALRTDTPRTATLGGCLIARSKRANEEDVLAIFREPSAVAHPLSLPIDGVTCWDGRFRIGVTTPGDQRLTIASCRPTMLPHEVRKRAQRLPPGVLMTIPALYDLEGIVHVPHIEYARTGTCARLTVRFAPMGANVPVFW